MPENKLSGKKILYIVTQTKWGGAQKYVWQLAKYFAKDNQVEIAYGEIANLDQTFLDQADKLGIKTIPVKNLMRNIEPAKELSAIRDLSKIIKQGQYNLIHLNSSKVGLLGTLAAQGYNMNPLNVRTRIVYTAHGFVFNEPLNKLQKLIYKMSEKFSTGLQTAIITVSDFDKQSALDNKICPARKMITIHNGLDFSEYDFLSKAEAKQELGLSEDKKYFGTIASFYETKGYPYLIEAIKSLVEQKSPLLQNHRWIFIGEGPEENNIKGKIERNNLQEYIKIVPAKNNDWKFLKAFDYFILPSVKEGLPYTILEAGLAGIPTIASRVGGIPEILTDNETGLLTTPANPLSLLKAMETLANNQILSKKLIENNEHNIRTRFSLNKTLAETEKLYCKLF